MDKNRSDYNLWQGLLAGDRQAFNDIYNHHFVSLYQYGMRMLQNEDAVRDCLHNLFVKLWENRKKLNSTQNVRFYLISALRNHIFNYHASENKIKKVEIDSEAIFDLKINVEAEYIKSEEQKEIAKQLIGALNQLTSKQREIIYLKYFEELSYNEIAEIMNLSIKGTYKLSARALEALRALLNVEKAVLLAMIFALKH